METTGILRQATNAKENTEKSQAIEQARIDILGKVVENNGKDATEAQVQEILNNYFNDVPEDLTDQTQEVTTKPSRYKVKLSEILNGVSIKYSTYTITTTVNNGTYTGETSIAENGTVTVTISANTNYLLPSIVTVTGATSSYNEATGVITLSNATENVTIIATCTESARALLVPVPLGATYSAGDEVTLNGEKFFVLSDDGTHVKLLAKYCLNQEGTAQSNKTYINYARKFSNSVYWSSSGNLDQTNPPDSAIAIKLAKTYGTAKGVKGRLMILSEAESIMNESNNTIKNILFGKWTDETKPVDGFLRYWLATAGDGMDVKNVYCDSTYSGTGSTTYSSTSSGLRCSPSFGNLIISNCQSKKMLTNVICITG